MRVALVVVLALAAAFALLPLAGTSLVVADRRRPRTRSSCFAGSIRDRALEAAAIYPRRDRAARRITRETSPPGAAPLRARPASSCRRATRSRARRSSGSGSRRARS
jgi:hypothetical protein